jgi:pyruvate ferredoxin oxidoreductase gamma subunit
LGKLLITRTEPVAGHDYEIKWHGRGGQGAITAAQIFAEAAYREGFQGVTASSSFGAERRGAAVSAATRISRQPIRLFSQIESPDFAVVLDHSLLKDNTIVQSLRPGGWRIINAPYLPKTSPTVNIAVVNATAISRDLKLIVSGLVIVNTPILGALCRVLDIVRLESLLEAVGYRFQKAKAREVNQQSMCLAYQKTQIIAAESFQ